MKYIVILVTDNAYEPIQYYDIEEQDEIFAALKVLEAKGLYWGWLSQMKFPTLRDVQKALLSKGMNITVMEDPQ